MITGIIGAMEYEVSALIEKMENRELKTVAGMDFFSGVLEGEDTVVVKCGIGKVNAAVCAQALIALFGAERVINTGVAGAISNALEIGDVVISEDLVQHDFDTTVTGDTLGVIPGLSAGAFIADDKLVTHAKAAAGVVLGSQNTVHTGRIATGDQFISTDEQRTKIKKNFNALCAEMEGGAIAQVCFLYGVPFVVIRAISDKADHSATVNFAEFAPVSARKSADIVCGMLKNITSKV